LFFGNFQKTQEDWEKNTKEIKGKEDEDDKKTNIVIVLLFLKSREDRGRQAGGLREETNDVKE
jgi:hypothetical protein